MERDTDGLTFRVRIAQSELVIIANNPRTRNVDGLLVNELPPCNLTLQRWTMPDASILETDPNFPSGPWTGFFLQTLFPGRHMMDLGLTFQNGVIQGEGRDWVGKFTLKGRYEIATGQCSWHKRYQGKHDVYYRGFNEGKGIWGVWEITNASIGLCKGGFHIWPEGMADPTQPHLSEEADWSLDVDEPAIITVGG